eukprot:XP_001701095.1 glutathione S-transferase [Chlamydomonas reinhardtii]
MAPKIIYFPVRGRAEAMKLALAAVKQDFEFEQVEYSTMKAHPDQYPFGQCPRLVDGDIDLVQSNAILRYLARHYKLYGKDEKEMGLVDMIMEGVESLRVKYLALVYQEKLADAAMDQHWSTHCDPNNSEQRNGGAHLVFFSRLLQRNAAGAGKVFVGAGLTMADLCVFDIVDLHNRIFPDKMKEVYPELLAFHDHVAALPGIKEYLASPKRVAAVNGNNLG